jgi:hypothetical protein
VRTLVPHVLAPVFVLVLMTFALLVMTGRSRLADLRERRLRISDIALGQNVWPDKTAQVGNAFNNQFQLPLLFYVLVIFALMTGKQDYVFIVAEWLFVLLRLVHAAIHVTSNNVVWRFQAYVAGAVVLMLMWAWYAIRILLAI